MYAELLELNPGSVLNPQVDVEDGLPDDLDTGAWMAVSGVPVGKRCLAVTYTSSGIAGTGADFLTPRPSVWCMGLTFEYSLISTLPWPVLIAQFQILCYGPDWWGNT